MKISRALAYSFELTCAHHASIEVTAKTHLRARFDRRRYPTGKRVRKKELRALKIEPEDFHGEWNCGMKPRKERIDHPTPPFAGP